MPLTVITQKIFKSNHRSRDSALRSTLEPYTNSVFHTPVVWFFQEYTTSEAAFLAANAFMRVAIFFLIVRRLLAVERMYVSLQNENNFI